MAKKNNEFDNVARDMIYNKENKKFELERKINDENTSEEERKELQKELDSIDKSLAFLYDRD